MAKFLTEEWIKEYAKVWNEDEELRNGLKKFSATIKYYIEGSDQPPVYIKVEKGEVVESGLAGDGKYDFEMWATPENWKKLATGEIGPKAAMATKTLKFKGSMLTAMKYMGPFGRSLELMSKVPTEW
jgi:putative sterol carrier protein